MQGEVRMKTRDVFWIAVVLVVALANLGNTQARDKELVLRGKITVTDAKGNTRITLDPESGIILHDAKGAAAIKIDTAAGAGQIAFRDGDIRIGGFDSKGKQVKAKEKA